MRFDLMRNAWARYDSSMRIILAQLCAEYEGKRWRIEWMRLIFRFSYDFRLRTLTMNWLLIFWYGWGEATEGIKPSLRLVQWLWDHSKWGRNCTLAVFWGLRYWHPSIYTTDLLGTSYYRNSPYLHGTESMRGFTNANTLQTRCLGRNSKSIGIYGVFSRSDCLKELRMLINTNVESGRVGIWSLRVNEWGDGEI